MLPRVPLRLTLALVVATRLLVLLLLRPGGGLIDSYGDFGFYRDLAELTLERRPFVDFWVEYPPLFPWLLAGLYRLALHLPGWPSATAPLQVTLGSFLLLCDLANILLVRRIAARLHGSELGDAAAALYALQPFVLLAGFGWFDAFPLVFLLLALDAALAGRAWLAGLALGLGGLAKLIPVVVAPAVVRALGSWRRAAVAGAVGAAVAAAAFVPLLATGSPYVWASLRATLVNRSSWETVWALMEGYWRVGTVAPVRERTFVDAADRLLHPATLPWTAIGLVQALLLAWLLFAPATAQRPRAVVALGALGLYVFLLFGKGYSPQFLVYELPLLLALWPSRRGLLYTLGLTALGVLEWPVVLSLFPDRHDMIALVVGARTALWLVIVAELAAEVWPAFAQLWRRFATPAGWLASAGVAATVLAIGYLGALHLPERGEQAPVLAYLRGFAETSPVFASSRTAFYRFAPTVGADRAVLAADAVDPTADARIQRLRSIAAAAPDGYWVVLDHSEGDPAWRDRLERELAVAGSRTTDRWFGYYHLLGFIRPDPSRAGLRPLDADFGDQLDLTGYSISADQLDSQAPLRVLLAWRVLARPARDYKLFVHLLDDADERIVAQADHPLDVGGRTTSAWSPGERALTGADLLAPATGLPRAGRLRVGLYDGATGARLAVAAGRDYVDLPTRLPAAVSD